jgi:hypothetical protein
MVGGIQRMLVTSTKKDEKIYVELIRPCALQFIADKKKKLGFCSKS